MKIWRQKTHTQSNKQTFSKLRPPYPQVSSRETRANNVAHLNKVQYKLGATTLGPALRVVKMLHTDKKQQIRK